jgi:putative acetyltransferase
VDRRQGHASDRNNVAIRPETADDAGAIHDVVAAAFGSEVEAQLVEAIRASPEYRPDLALVAVLDTAVVGHVMISGAALYDGDRRHRVVTLSPLAVAPHAQRRGVGSALVHAVTDRADRAGEPLVLVEGDPGNYRRFGFEPAARYGIEFPLPSWAPPEAAQVLRLRAYDARIRGRVVYPPAFDGVVDHS